jgi:hypothetical protein
MLGRLAKGEQTVGDLAAPHRMSLAAASRLEQFQILDDLCTYRDVLCLPNKKQ